MIGRMANAAAECDVQFMHAAYIHYCKVLVLAERHGALVAFVSKMYPES